MSAALLEDFVRKELLYAVAAVGPSPQEYILANEAADDAFERLPAHLRGLWGCPEMGRIDRVGMGDEPPPEDLEAEVRRLTCLFQNWLNTNPD